jgi:hypothetical protein
LLPALNCEKASHRPALAKTQLRGDYVYDLTAALAAEVNRTGCKSKESVVFAAADICAGVEVSAALANQNFAGIHLLARVALYAQTLCV